MTTRAIVLHPEDNVANSLDDISSGEVVEWEGGSVRTTQDIPYGHKIALCAIPSGKTILKYGESIGIARGDIAEGECVHVHNVESLRGRGDKGAAS